MKLIANAVNGNYLESILPGPDDLVEGVLAAIAYGSVFNNQNDDFIGNCLRHRYRLDIWMRYDHTVPVAVDLLKRLLRHKGDNIFCRLIPDRLHSKVIWWKGYGAYIGSANLTDRAWTSNIEAGVFMTESDLQRDGMDIELKEFFDELRALQVARDLDEKIIAEQEEFAAMRKGLADVGRAKRKIPEWQGILWRSKEKAIERKRERFRQEWHNTLANLSHIADVLRQNRPSWVPEDTPINWQVDQFLHAFYYNKVGEGSRKKPYLEFYERNRHAPNAALKDAVSWWRETSSAPSKEDITFSLNAPLVRDRMARDKLLGLSSLEFSEVCQRVHATVEHALHLEPLFLGKPKNRVIPLEERVQLFAEWLMKQQNERGWSVLQLLDYVLYGGREDELWSRLYEAHASPEIMIPHYKLNTIAEVVGWARPEVAPPRNGRTSKALKALGYDVMEY
jgi:hypothetical protein